MKPAGRAVALGKEITSVGFRTWPPRCLAPLRLAGGGSGAGLGACALGVQLQEPGERPKLA